MPTNKYNRYTDVNAEFVTRTPIDYRKAVVAVFKNFCDSWKNQKNTNAKPENIYQEFSYHSKININEIIDIYEEKLKSLLIKGVKAIYKDKKFFELVEHICWKYCEDEMQEINAGIFVHEFGRHISRFFDEEPIDDELTAQEIKKRGNFKRTWSKNLIFKIYLRTLESETSFRGISEEYIQGLTKEENCIYFKTYDCEHENFIPVQIYVPNRKYSLYGGILDIRTRSIYSKNLVQKDHLNIFLDTVYYTDIYSITAMEDIQDDCFGAEIDTGTFYCTACVNRRIKSVNRMDYINSIQCPIFLISDSQEKDRINGILNSLSKELDFNILS